MRQGGRASAAQAAHMAIVKAHPKAVIPGDRPDPPSRLGERQAEEWRAIVARMPPRWFERESWPLLEALCIATVEMIDIDRELMRYGKGIPKADKAFRHYRMLSSMRARCQVMVGQFSTKLRLAHQSRYDRLKANDHAVKSTGAHIWKRDNRMDRKVSVRSGGPVARDEDGSGRVAEDRDQEDLRQSGADAAGDHQLRAQERQDLARGHAAFGAFVRPGRAEEQPVIFDGAKPGTGGIAVPVSGEDGEDESDAVGYPADQRWHKATRLP